MTLVWFEETFQRLPVHGVDFKFLEESLYVHWLTSDIDSGFLIYAVAFVSFGYL